MLFNSTEFVIFLGLFLGLYAVLRHSLTARNSLVVLASYVFYGWWDYRFVGLLLATSLVDFAAGLALERSAAPGRRRAWLLVSLVANLGVLVLFKYFDFFRESLELLLGALGVSASWRGLDLVLPVGISFYTFQSISYVVDVYRREVPACRSLVRFLAYVSFFPQLVAGPIERASSLLTQLESPRVVNAARLELGTWLILWGLFKKVVIADNLAPLVEMVYRDPAPGGPAVVLGTVAFALQIYGDFSGYSDIARGVAGWLGFELTRNFELPYFATNLRDFWRRWHISLSTWLRDYVYRPLGGNRRGPTRTALNLLATLLLGGLWHGAAVNFVLWGIWHGLGLVLHRVWSKTLGWRMPPLLGWGVTMGFVLFGWMLFRAGSAERVLALTQALTVWTLPTWWATYLGNLALLASPLVAVQLWQLKTKDLDCPVSLGFWSKTALQGALLFGILLYWRAEDSPFIYFQF